MREILETRGMTSRGLIRHGGKYGMHSLRYIQVGSSHGLFMKFFYETGEAVILAFLNTSEKGKDNLVSASTRRWLQQFNDFESLAQMKESGHRTAGEPWISVKYNIKENGGDVAEESAPSREVGRNKGISGVWRSVDDPRKINSRRANGKRSNGQSRGGKNSGRGDTASSSSAAFAPVQMLFLGTAGMLEQTIVSQLSGLLPAALILLLLRWIRDLSRRQFGAAERVLDKVLIAGRPQQLEPRRDNTGLSGFAPAGLLSISWAAGVIFLIAAAAGVAVLLSMFWNRLTRLLERPPKKTGGWAWITERLQHDPQLFSATIFKRIFSPCML
jgi:hypothetical protein